MVLFAFMNGACEQFMKHLPPSLSDVKAVHVESCLSTNLLAREILESPDGPAVTLVCADYQEAGHGRRGRIWHSRMGADVLFTLGARPSRIGYTLDTRLPICCGAVVQIGILEATGVPLICKWPNDLIADDGRKVAGIIILNRSEALYIGVGINVNSIASDFPSDLRKNATSLREIGDKEYDRNSLFSKISIQLMDHLACKAGYSAPELMKRWLECSRPIGELITIQRNGNSSKVTPLRIVQDTGELLVREADGSESLISSADYMD
jgi:BirA family biotin operon repressor/biotin-[acetyl-CoA-carboxylase] ligase